MLLNKQNEFFLFLPAYLGGSKGEARLPVPREHSMGHKCKDDGAASQQVIPGREKASLREAVTGGFLPDPTLGGP